MLYVAIIKALADLIKVTRVARHLAVNYRCTFKNGQPRFHCVNARCQSMAYRLDGEDDCQDGIASDEGDVSSPSFLSYPCPQSFSPCISG